MHQICQVKRFSLSGKRFTLRFPQGTGMGRNLLHPEMPVMSPGGHSGFEAHPAVETAPGAPPASRRPPRPRCGSVALPSLCVCRMALHSPGQSIKEGGPRCLGPHSASRHCPEHYQGINPLNLHKPPLSLLSLSLSYQRGN